MQESSQPILPASAEIQAPVPMQQTELVHPWESADASAEAEQTAADPGAAADSAVVLLSDQPILPEPQPVSAALLVQQAPAADEAVLSSSAARDEQQSLQSDPASIHVVQQASEAFTGPTEAVAVSDLPILDPAAADVHTVPTGVQHVIQESSADAPVHSQHHQLLQTTTNMQQSSEAQAIAVTSVNQVLASNAAEEQLPIHVMTQGPPVPAMPSKLRQSRSDLQLGQQLLPSGLQLSGTPPAQVDSSAALRRTISTAQSGPTANSPPPAWSPSAPTGVLVADTRQQTPPLRASSAMPFIPEIPRAPALPPPVQVIATTAAVTEPVPVQPVSAPPVDFVRQPAAHRGPFFMRSFGSNPLLASQSLPVMQQQQQLQPPGRFQQAGLVQATRGIPTQPLSPSPMPLDMTPAQAPQFMSTAALAPADSFQPMTAAVTVDTQGPLSKGMQDSWNTAPTAVLQQQPAVTVPQTASSWHQGTLHAPLMSRVSQNFMPLAVSHDSLSIPALPRSATPTMNATRDWQQPAFQTVQQQSVYEMQRPSYAALQTQQPRAAAAHMSYGSQQDPLRHSMSLTSTQQSLTAPMPYAQRPGTVIQPMPGPVIVGHQAPGLQVQPNMTGFTMVPLQQAAQQQGMQQQQPAGQPVLMRTQTGGVHASRALRAFSQSRSSFASMDLPLSDSYTAQGVRESSSLLQCVLTVVTAAPQP